MEAPGCRPAVLREGRGQVRSGQVTWVVSEVSSAGTSQLQ